MDKKDIENIVTATEIHVDEFLKRMEILGDKLQEWGDTYGNIPKHLQDRLNKIWDQVK